jgi:hypothetical protein
MPYRRSATRILAPAAIVDLANDMTKNFHELIVTELPFVREIHRRVACHLKVDTWMEGRD